MPAAVVAQIAAAVGDDRSVLALAGTCRRLRALLRPVRRRILRRGLPEWEDAVPWVSWRWAWRMAPDAPVALTAAAAVPTTIGLTIYTEIGHSASSGALMMVLVWPWALLFVLGALLFDLLTRSGRVGNMAAGMAAAGLSLPPTLASVLLFFKESLALRWILLPLMVQGCAVLVFALRYLYVVANVASPFTRRDLVAVADSAAHGAMATVTSLVLLALKGDGTVPSLPWWLVFAPAYVVAAVVVAHEAWHALESPRTGAETRVWRAGAVGASMPRQRRLSNAHEVMGVPAFVPRVRTVMALVAAALTLVALLNAYADGHIQIFAVVLIPAYVVLFIWLCACGCSVCGRRRVEHVGGLHDVER
ncbi:uncharacterized protein AMSG_11113 [Thecamonas trahens ATCC 50062]|uniref:Uncharacterized protein n=1 Tax=Thecamonas trahens ATCC 50062 TaxID=461836 RepID=A0A0L0DSX0_THETB|nr:hypothetical protein AMSG_11113 [Thecamonas trahens ATCC 50062]KNC55449.1 hypothetical protein AMSG_11113 [Thecamonas trahens ATCC 50062]|eukprot:XP_013752986.1 hypothetical protein AMSG_11113 [Thecamonas trahens ATCC 50062]